MYLSSAGCCLSGQALEVQLCLHLTWTKDEIDPGAGRPSKRQEDGCVLWAQQRLGGKSGEQSWRCKLQLVNQQTVSNRELDRKANMKLQVSKG